LPQSSTIPNPIQLGIVSPCSTCKNQLSAPKEGHPPCPRRSLQQRKTELTKAGVDTQHLEHLTLTGREFAPENLQNLLKSGSNDLRNPVYWDDGGAVLVWVATLADNGGVRGVDGRLAVTNLLDKTFDTAYLQCHPLPVVPAIDEASYFSNGSFMEWDQLEIRFSSNQQLDSQSGSPEVVLIDGFAQKVNFAFLVPRRGLEKDHTSPLT
jgi:hypothetical protein